MITRFTLKNLFSSEEITNLVQNFGFKRLPEDEIENAIQNAFSDYILSALSELSDDHEDQKKLYLEKKICH